MATLVLATATTAVAERGGNGNGNSARAGSNSNNGRGPLARELRGLNAAHANASQNSMPGQLNTYKTAQENVATALDAETAALVEFDRLIGMTEEKIAVAFPDGGYRRRSLSRLKT